jgi:microcin C transport system substrate-binding protein
MPSGLQGLFLNTRRDKFKDIRVRKALTYAFDFERLNRTLLYGVYKRCDSVFANSPLAAEGTPSRDELALLDPYRDQLPPEVFGPAFTAPESPRKRDNTKNLDIAAALLKEVGYKLENGRLTGPDDKPFEISFLIDDPLMETILDPYLKALKSLGIKTSTELAAIGTYESRVRTYDYDVISARFVTSLTPGTDLRELFGSAAADQPAGANLAGIRNPVVDGLIDQIIGAHSRREMTTAARALDRVIMWNYYVVPEWYSPNYDVAYWNRFGMPRTEPTYFDHLTWVVRDLWWVDPGKETKLRAEYVLPQREPGAP